MYKHEATTDELFRIVMIDKPRKVKVNIQLRDKDGDEIPVRETIEKLSEWVSDKLKLNDNNNNNQCRNQIFPLMSNAVVGALIKLLGPAYSTFLLSHESVRYSLIHAMVIGFYLLKWMQKKDIKIFTHDEPVTEEDIEMYDRISKANDTSIQAMAAGVNPQEVIKKLVQSGKLKAQDLEQMGVPKETTEEWIDSSKPKSKEVN